MSDGAPGGIDTHGLTPFFEPQSVAVIGASRDPEKVGGSVLANLIAAGFAGRIVPVNARGGSVQGLPAVPSVRLADGPIDLAVIAVPAPDVLAALKDCVASGVRGAVVLSAGFREMGEDGRAREAELRAWLRDQPLRVLGPNCVGWIRPQARLNVTFAPGMPEPGGIAFISHSGALAVAILDWSRARRMGFSLFASLGNQADLTETDVLRAAADDPATRVIAAYIEGLADGRAFFEALREVVTRKPVVVLKTGRSSEAARAVASHTGALAGSDRAFDAAIRQAGAIRAATLEELFEVARALDMQPLPRGGRLLILTNGGGLGVVAADAAAQAGLAVPALPPDAQERLRAVLPATASVANPVDIVGDADEARFRDALRAVGGEVADAALVLLTAQAATDSRAVARAIIDATRGWSVPVAGAFVGGALMTPGAAVLEDAGIPCYAFPERAVAALAGMSRFAERRRQSRMRAVRAPRADAPPAEAIRCVAALRALGTPRLGLLELQALLSAYGIAVATARLARTPAEAGGLAAEVGVPVALKLVSPAIVHKTDVGGVRLGLGSSREVVEATEAMLARARAERPDAPIDGVLVQPMVKGGQELLLGAVHDPQFGPVVMVGFGGIYVEVLQDVAARLAPIEPAEAQAMLDELRMAPALHGARGGPAVDLSALGQTIARFSRLAAELTDLTEVELNPLIARPDGVIAVDARATLRCRAGDGLSHPGVAATPRSSPRDP
jgi:acetyltransferase